VETLFHEHVHLLSAHGTDHTEVEPYMRHTSVQALEEGVTEAYAFAKLDDFVDEVGIEQIAPAIKEVDDPPTLTPEALELTRLADRVCTEVPGLDGGEVLRRLAVVNPRDKWGQVTRITWDASGLQAVVPPAQHAEAEVRLGRRMWDAYAGQTAEVVFQAGQSEIHAIRQEVSATGRLTFR